MSKINLFFVIMLIAFAMCLPACGESGDTTNTEPAQSSTEQPASQTQAADSATAASEQQSTAESTAGSGKTNQQDAYDAKNGNADNGVQAGGEDTSTQSVQNDAGQSGNGNNGAQAGGEGAASQGSADADGQQNVEAREEEGVEETVAYTEPQATVQNPTVHTDPEVRDNAEVNFNDL